MTLLKKYHIVRRLIIGCVISNLCLLIVLFFHLKRRNEYNITYKAPPSLNSILPVSTNVVGLSTNIQITSEKTFSRTKVNDAQLFQEQSAPITRSMRYNFAIVGNAPVFYFNSKIPYRLGDFTEDGEIVYISSRFVDLVNETGTRFRWINSDNPMSPNSSLSGGITGLKGRISISEDE